MGNKFTDNINKSSASLRCHANINMPVSDITFNFRICIT